MPHAYEMSQYLLARDILVDFRPGAGIRIAPHFYTTDEEVEKVIAAIDEAMHSGEWKRHERGHAVVT
jgi:kynureninase